jgi:FtsH-binding integral membrane protein
MEDKSMRRAGYWLIIAAGLCSIAASLLSVYIGIRNPAPIKWWAYVIMCFPPLISAWALRRPRRAKTVTAAILLVLFVFLSFSLGPLFVPAALLMIIAAILSAPPPQK